MESPNSESKLTLYESNIGKWTRISRYWIREEELVTFVSLEPGDAEPVLQGNISSTEVTSQGGPGAPLINTLGRQK
jgi:hypothetical protein